MPYIYKASLFQFQNDHNSVFYIGNIYINRSPLHYNRSRSSYFMIDMGIGFGTIEVDLLYTAIPFTERNVDLMPSVAKKNKRQTLFSFNI